MNRNQQAFWSFENRKSISSISYAYTNTSILYMLLEFGQETVEQVLVAHPRDLAMGIRYAWTTSMGCIVILSTGQCLRSTSGLTQNSRRIYSTGSD